MGPQNRILHLSAFRLIATECRFPRNQHGYCIAATILLSKVPTMPQVRVTACKSRMRADGRVVLNNLSEQIRECLQHAENCARKAAAQSCPKLKQDFLELEQRWLFLARSYEFTERLTDFSDEAKRNANKLPNAY
jgi:hypothetical protein